MHIAKSLEEQRSLIKVEIHWDGGKGWVMQYPHGYKVFHGSPEGFAKFMRKLKASDSVSEPASVRNMTYLQIAQELMVGKTRHVWIWSNILNQLTSSVFSEASTDNIGVKNPGILDLPQGKNFWDVGLNHYISLGKSKGKSAIMKALLNLERWNKNDNPKISQMARIIINQLKKNSEWKSIGENRMGYFRNLKEEDQPRFTPDDAKDIGNQLDVDWDEIDLTQFTVGMNAETEHDDVTGGDPLAIGKIALAHLKEDPLYYTKLFMYVEEAPNYDDVMKKVRNGEDLTPDEEDLVKKNLKPKEKRMKVKKEFQISGTRIVLEKGDVIVFKE